MTARDRLRQMVVAERARLRQSIPADREAAIVALVRARDRLPSTSAAPDLITGRQMDDLGGNRALQCCLEAAEGLVIPGEASVGWADAFLASCDRLAGAELVLQHAETGFMRLAEDADGTIHAWIATKRPPTSWRERADIDWWAAASTRTVSADRSGSAGERLVRSFAYQAGYPPGATLGGCTVQTYEAVLSRLIDRALASRALGEPAGPVDEPALIAGIAADLATDPAIVSQALAAFTLDAGNAGWHASVPGVTPAPLVRLGSGRLAWSLRGLTTEPLFFLLRELRRRDAQGYHATAWMREGVFRTDLYELFDHKRFVTSANGIQVPREDGRSRTDIDAVVFDRKTGTLAIFELKSQDPFARSAAELERQRDNVLYANRQLAGALAWVKRYGADELLRRVDARTAKTFRAHRVVPFVLGRYIAHFSGGPEPDRRAAWGTWPQLLRLLDGQPPLATLSNPLGSLFTRLSQDTPALGVPDGTPAQEIPLAGARLVVYPSWAAFQAVGMR